MTTVETADGVTQSVDASPQSAPVTAPPTIDAMEPVKVMVGDEEVFDFSSPSKPHKFRIDGDVFEAIRELPALTAMEFGQYANTLDGSNDLKEQGEAVERMFRMVLTKESGELFISRLSDVDNPIGAKQMNGIMMWLMEKYGFRPTAPSEGSSDGS